MLKSIKSSIMDFIAYNLVIYSFGVVPAEQCLTIYAKVVGRIAIGGDELFSFPLVKKQSVALTSASEFPFHVLKSTQTKSRDFTMTNFV